MRGGMREIRACRRNSDLSTTPTTVVDGIKRRSGWPRVRVIRLRAPEHLPYSSPKLNRSIRSPIAGLFKGTYGLLWWVTGLGKLSRLRPRQRSQAPVGLDELQQGSVVSVGARDMSGLGVGRNHQRGYPGAVTKVVERLNVAGVVITAALVEGDDDGCTLP